MTFRKLRIAWSVFWGLACVLLIAFWVRSYWVVDVVDRTPIPAINGSVFIMSGHGSVGVSWSHYENGGLTEVWSSSINVPLRLLVSATALVTAVPWMQLPNRFRLRTLLIATTLVAVVLGSVAYTVKW